MGSASGQVLAWVPEGEQWDIFASAVGEASKVAENELVLFRDNTEIVEYIHTKAKPDDKIVTMLGHRAVNREIPAAHFPGFHVLRASIEITPHRAIYTVIKSNKVREIDPEICRLANTIIHANTAPPSLGVNALTNWLKGE